MDLTLSERIFIIDTLYAIVNRKARIGQKHYRNTLDRVELKDLIEKLEGGVVK